MSSILLSMRSEEFVALRRDDWNRLEDLLARAGAANLNALAPAQVLTMAALYRRATADLARAQRDLARRAGAPLPQRPGGSRPWRRLPARRPRVAPREAAVPATWLPL